MNFRDILFSGDFIQAYNVVIEGKDTKIKGILFIESEKDRLFWEGLFGDEILSRYEFSMANGPSSIDEGERGKRRFYNNFQYANEYSIFAIDSDFSHFTPDRELFNKEVIENAYIIHTYAYSKESLCNSIENLDCAVSKYRYFDKHEYRFKEFLTNYSNIIYMPLLSYLFLFNQHDEPLNETEFSNLLTPHIDTFFSGNWDAFKNRMDVFITAHGQLENVEFEEFIDKVKEFGLEYDNAYQFINGHTLEKSIINPIISKVRQKLSDQVITDLKLCTSKGDVISNKIKELKNHFKDDCCFQTLKAQSKAYIESDLYKNMSKQFLIMTP